VAVVGVGDVVAEVAGSLLGVAGLLGDRVAAADDDLLPPDGTVGAGGEDVVLRPEEEVRDEGAADAVVPRRWVNRQGAPPHVADVGDVRVVHVEGWEQRCQVCRGDGVQVDVCVVGAWGAVDLARAAEAAGGGRERAQKVLLVVRLRVANERLPVGIPKPLAHGGPNAGPRLCEEGAPALEAACAVEGQDLMAQAGARAALAEAEER